MAQQLIDIVAPGDTLPAVGTKINEMMEEIYAKGIDVKFTWNPTTNTLRIAGNATVPGEPTIEWQPEGDPNKFQVTNRTGLWILQASNQAETIQHPALTLTEANAGYVSSVQFDAEAITGEIAQLVVSAGYLFSVVGSGTGVIGEERTVDGTTGTYTLTVTGTGATTAGIDAFSSATIARLVFSGAEGHSQSATAPAIATAGTIATANIVVSRLAPAGAITGVIMAPGTTPGQKCTAINQSAAASTITMAASGTSNVANGTSCVIAGLTAKSFTWNSVTSLWYPES